MNGSFRHSWFYLGSLALVTLAGCGGERQPAQSPGRSEVFESRAPEAAQPAQGYEQRQPGGAQGMEHGGVGQPMGSPEHMQHMQQGQPGAGQGQLGQGQGQLGQGQGQLGPGQAGFPAEVMTEQQLCSQLRAGSDIQAQDTENGVRLIIRPKSGGDLAALREAAQRIEDRMQPTATSAPRGDIASQCALFDVAQLGARATIQERPNELHLILTTADTAQVNAIRREVREFVAAGGQQQQSGGQQQQQQY